jgi:hypothetical protein
MREIKFRGWHTGQKKMFSAEEMAADQLTLLPTGSFINVSGDNTRLSTIYPSDKFIPLQYTGLKDKNGKETYDGDIIKADDRHWLREIVWFEAGWALRCIRSDEGPHYTYAYITHPDQWQGEVIGNVYENPDLLKDS